jgi:hypothetical protein
MKLLKRLYRKISLTVSGVAVIVIFCLIAIMLAAIAGMFGYFLLSIAFPQYIMFDWYWIRFIALGVLLLCC